MSSDQSAEARRSRAPKRAHLPLRVRARGFVSETKAGGIRPGLRVALLRRQFRSLSCLEEDDRYCRAVGGDLGAHGHDGVGARARLQNRITLPTDSLRRCWHRARIAAHADHPTRTDAVRPARWSESRLHRHSTVGLEPWVGEDPPDLGRSWAIKPKFAVNGKRSCAELQPGRGSFHRLSCTCTTSRSNGSPALPSPSLTASSGS